MSARIVKSGTIGGRGFCVVERSPQTGYPYDYGGFCELIGIGRFGGGWLCGYVDATGSRFDGIDDEDDPAFAGLGVEITYTGRGVPGCDGAPSTGCAVATPKAASAVMSSRPPLNRVLIVGRQSAVRSASAAVTANAAVRRKRRLTGRFCAYSVSSRSALSFSAYSL